MKQGPGQVIEDRLSSSLREQLGWRILLQTGLCKSRTITDVGSDFLTNTTYLGIVEI